MRRKIKARIPWDPYISLRLPFRWSADCVEGVLIQKENPEESVNTLTEPGLRIVFHWADGPIASRFSRW